MERVGRKRLSVNSEIGLSSESLKPFDLKKTPQWMLKGPLLRTPLHELVGAKYSIPNVHRDAEIVMPHVVVMVQIVDGSLEPEAQFGPLMLELMRVRR